MNDKEFRDVCALLAMQIFLRDDMDRDTDKQMGRKWIADQSYKLADIMAERRKQ